MTPEQEEQLRRLLSLKRHEIPPPGYFNDFSRQVMARISAEKLAPREVSWLDASWIRRLLGAIEMRTALAGALGAAVCGLLIVGIINSEKADSTRLPELTSENPGANAMITPASLAEAHPEAGLVIESTTNPIAQPGSLFDHPHLDVEPAAGHDSLLPPH